MCGGVAASLLIDHRLPDLVNCDSIVSGVNRIRGANIRLSLGSAGVEVSGLA